MYSKALLSHCLKSGEEISEMLYRYMTYVDILHQFAYTVFEKWGRLCGRLGIFNVCVQ